jgi:hypothetical protein
MGELRRVVSDGGKVECSEGVGGGQSEKGEFEGVDIFGELHR